MVRAQVAIDKAKSKAQINKDIKELEKVVNGLKIVAKLNKTDAKKSLNTEIETLSQQVDYLKLKVKINKKLARIQLGQDVSDLENTTKTLGLKAKIKQGTVHQEVQQEINKGQTAANKNPIDINVRINEAQSQKLIGQVENFGKKNSKLFKNTDFTQTYNNILESAFSASSSKEMQSVRTQIGALKEQLDVAGLSGLSFGDRMSKGLGKAFSLFSWTGTAMLAFNTIRNQTNEILELDKAVTKLYKVQDDISSRDQFPQYLDRSIKKAQELSVKTKSLIESSVEWSKIGFNLKDADALAEVSTKLENVGDMNITNATQSLISAAQAFEEVDGFGDEQYVEKAERIGDKINAIGNKYSISTEGIAEALQNSSAALSVAGNDLDESIALYAAGNKIFQSPGEFGNAMKVGAMRLRGQKGELEKMGEDVDGVIEGVSKIQTQIANLTKGKVNIFEADNETLKSTYQIYTDIGKVYKDMSDKDQASLTEILFGKQRGSAGSALLLNIEEAANVYQDSLTATGSMTEEFAKHQESAEGAIIRLQESMIGLSSNVISGDLIKNLANAGTAVLTFTDNTHLLQAALVAVIGVGISKFALGFGKTFSDVSKSVSTFSNAMNILDKTKGSGLNSGVLKSLGIATKDLTDNQLKLFMSSKLLNDQDKINIISNQELTKDKKAAKLATLGLTTATDGATISTVAATGATFSFRGAILGLGAAIKSAFLSNPISWVILGITTAITAVTAATNAYNQSVQDTIDKSNEITTAWKEQNNALRSNKATIDSVSVNYEKLSKGVGTHGENLYLTTEQYKEYNDIVNKIADMFPTMVQGYTDEGKCYSNH